MYQQAIFFVVVGLTNSLIIAVGAGSAGPVLAQPLFRQFNKIHYKRIKKMACASIRTGPLYKSFLRPCLWSGGGSWEGGGGHMCEAKAKE